MFSERRGRRSLHPNIQQIDKPVFLRYFGLRGTDCHDQFVNWSRNDVVVG